MTTAAPALTQCTNCGRYGWHTTERCPEPVRGPAGQTDSMTNGGKRDNATSFTATVEGTGPTARHRIEVEIDQDGPGGPVALVDCTGGLVLDAAALRRLAAVCMDAADQLDEADQ